MKVILRTPCCGMNIEVEGTDPDVIAKELTFQMNKHFEEECFKCTTLADWWEVSSNFDIGMVIEDGESVEDEYIRVMHGRSVLGRMETMALYGFLVGLDTILMGPDSSPPMLPVPDVSMMETISFQTGLEAGALYAKNKRLVGKYPPPPPMLTAEQLVNGDLLEDDPEPEPVAMTPTEGKRAFDELKRPTSGMRVH